MAFDRDPTASVELGRTGIIGTRMGLGTAPLASIWWRFHLHLITAILQQSLPRTLCLSIYHCWQLRMDRVLSLHADITAQLTPISNTPALDASVLLAHVIHKPRTWVIAHPELTLTIAQQKNLEDSVIRLQADQAHGAFVVERLAVAAA